MDSMDRLKFLNNYPILQSAVCDSPSPLPGYILEEIKSLSQESTKDCEQLLEYLLYRLDNSDACNTKIRTLKIMEHLLMNGCEEFNHFLRKEVSSIQAACNFSGPPNPVYGNKQYEMVRKLADEVMKLLFNGSPSIEPVKTVMTGLGSTVSSKRMEGFGNNPTADSRSGSGNVISEMSDMVDKMFNITSQKVKQSSSSLDMKDVNSKFESYKPQFERDIEEVRICDDFRKEIICEPTKPKKGKRKPGKAGGGWDDDDPTVIGSVSSKSSSSCMPITDESIDDSLDMRITSAVILDYKAEKMFVDKFVSEYCVRTFKNNNIQDVNKIVSTLNCEKLLQFIESKLKDYSEPSSMNALILLEILLHGDVINPELFYEVIYPTLQLMKENTPTGPTRDKALKNYLIIEKLYKMTNET